MSRGRLKGGIYGQVSRHHAQASPRIPKLAVKFGLLFRGTGQRSRRVQHKPTPACGRLNPRRTPELRGLLVQSHLWSVLCGPGPLPQQLIPGTRDSGSLGPQTLSINKIQQKPAARRCPLPGAVGTDWKVLGLPWLRGALWPWPQLAAQSRGLEPATISVLSLWVKGKLFFMAG